nr:hypothetical protein [Sphingobium fuliginis]
MGAVRHQPGGQGLFLIVGKPGRVVDALGQRFQHQNGDEKRRRAFDDEQPTPIHRHQETRGQRRANRQRRWHHRDHQPHDLRHCAPVEPLREIIDDGRHEPRFSNAQGQTNRIEASGIGYEPGGNRDKAPGDQQGRDPPARAYSGEQQVGGYAGEEEADVEEARRHPVSRCRQADIRPHVEGGDAHIGAIDDIHENAQRQRRQNMPRREIDRRFLQLAPPVYICTHAYLMNCRLSTVFCFFKC